ncbi:MAG: HpsJ family protein [Rhizonema sp. PD37]|nr:HpsJ family protein [Rhizonema sp. PD37]
MNNNSLATMNASRTLKVAGIILILSFFVDFLILLFPVQPTNKGWLIELATALVDRGIVPMIGISLLFAGYWIDTPDDTRPQGIDLRFPALILSSVLGLMFLLIFPLHINNVRQASDQTVSQINKDAEQRENLLNNKLSQVEAQLGNDQVKAALEKQKSQVKEQFTTLLKDDQRYKEALNNPTLPAQQKELLKKFKANPQELDKFIAQQADPQAQAQQQLGQIRSRKEEDEKQAKDVAWKSGLRIGIGSLLLSIGYIIIGWTGIRSMGTVQSAKRVPAR